MTERPASELLAEFHQIRPFTEAMERWSSLYLEAALQRLTRAEQALADIEAACGSFGETASHRYVLLSDIRTSLRASQDGAA